MRSSLIHCSTATQTAALFYTHCSMRYGRRHSMRSSTGTVTWCSLRRPGGTRPPSSDLALAVGRPINTFASDSLRIVFRVARCVVRDTEVLAQDLNHGGQPGANDNATLPGRAASSEQATTLLSRVLSYPQRSRHEWWRSWRQHGSTTTSKGDDKLYRATVN